MRQRGKFGLGRLLVRYWLGRIEISGRATVQDRGGEAQTSWDASHGREDTQEPPGTGVLEGEAVRHDVGQDSAPEFVRLNRRTRRAPDRVPRVPSTWRCSTFSRKYVSVYITKTKVPKSHYPNVHSVKQSILSTVTSRPRYHALTERQERRKVQHRLEAQRLNRLPTNSSFQNDVVRSRRLNRLIKREQRITLTRRLRVDRRKIRDEVSVRITLQNVVLNPDTARVPGTLAKADEYVGLIRRAVEACAVHEHERVLHREEVTILIECLAGGEREPCLCHARVGGDGETSV